MVIGGVGDDAAEWDLDLDIHPTVVLGRGTAELGLERRALLGWEE